LTEENGYCGKERGVIRPHGHPEAKHKREVAKPMRSIAGMETILNERERSHAKLKNPVIKTQQKERKLRAGRKRAKQSQRLFAHVAIAVKASDTEDRDRRIARTCGLGKFC